MYNPAQTTKQILTKYMSKTFVIGDIHNAAKALQEVIQKANVKSEDTIIFLGDYFDGWSEAKETFNLLMELQLHCDCVFIKGNHDEMVLRWLEETAYDMEFAMWYKHGGQATHDSLSTYFKQNIFAQDRVLRFLKNLKPYYIDNQNRLFVHAGFNSYEGVEKQYKTTKEELWWTRDFVTGCFNGYQEWLKRSYIYQEVYVGHTPTITFIDNRTTPIVKGNLTMMDTAAAFTGKLSLLNVESKELFQSDFCMKLYPDELGRNGYTYNQTKNK